MQKKLFSLAATTLAASLALAFPVHAAKPALGPTVEEAPLRGHLAFLSSDLLEGRGTGQRGGDLTVAYLEAQAMAAGLKPANGNSFRQAVKIAGVKALAAGEQRRASKSAARRRRLTFGKDWVWAPGDAKAVHAMDAEMVFVGYGIIGAGRRLERLQGPRRQGQDRRHDGQRPDADRSRAEPLQRQGPDLLRPLDLQV